MPGGNQRIFNEISVTWNAGQKRIGNIWKEIPYFVGNGMPTIGKLFHTLDEPEERGTESGESLFPAILGR
jgi:hypothetical protein